MQTPSSRRKFTTFLAASAGAALALPQWAFGATDNLDMARVVLGVPAGSMIDNIARQVAEVIKPGYAANTIVENKTGAGGILALSYLKTLPKDGSNIYVGVSSPLTVYPVTYKKLAYDADKDLAPIGSLGTFDLALAVGPMVPAHVKDLKGYFEWAKQNPTLANFGSPGAGSMLHFVGSMTARSAGVNLQHVPYRGPGPAVLEAVGGMVSGVVVPLVDVTEFEAQGKLRILGTTGDTRSRFVPHVPTFAEQGFGEYAMGVWIAAFVAAGTPEAQIKKLREVLKQGLEKPEVKAAMGKQLQAVKWGEPEQLQQNIHRERASWKKAVEALNFTPES